MDKLNKEQENAANFKSGIASVIAVPGAGKTKTMMERIGRLVTVHKVAPESILGLTFTRNAADEMKLRLESVLGEKAERVHLSTIHSFCYWLLKSQGKTFDLISMRETIILLRNICKKLGCKDLSIGMCIRELSLAKNNLITASEMKALYEGDGTMLKVAEVYEAYDREKEKQLQMDFDDLLISTLDLLVNDRETKERYQGRFAHVLVDEFQDTNPLQLQVIKALLNGDKDSSLWTCGDDWQSIYAFTGASIGNILKFKEMFPEATEYILNVNYRSTPQILSACQNLISHNERKIDKTLRTDNGNGDEVQVLLCANEEDEARAIAAEIHDLVKHRGYEYKDIAILYRANYQSRVVEEVLAEDKLPYHIASGINFYQRSEVKVLVDYMRLIYNPDDDDALLSIINVPNRYIGRKFTSELERYARTNDLHLYPALKSMSIGLPYIRDSVQGFIEIIETTSKSISPAELIWSLRITLDYDNYISQDEIPTPDDQKIANLNQLHLAASKYRDIGSFLSHADKFKDNNSSDKDGIQLMTIHKAKGLEFPVVFLVGLVEGVLPSKRGDIEEERRIAFVGMSRAMKHLYLSHYTECLNGQKSTPSQFISEIKSPKQ